MGLVLEMSGHNGQQCMQNLKHIRKLHELMSIFITRYLIVYS